MPNLFHNRVYALLDLMKLLYIEFLSKQNHF